MKCSLQKFDVIWSACHFKFFNLLSANPTKWSNTLKQFVGKNCVFDHFVKLVLEGLIFSRLLPRLTIKFQ